MDIPRKADAPRRIRAVTEAVLLLVFTFCAAGLVHQSSIAAWRWTFPTFMFAENTTMLLVPLLWLWVTGQRFAEHGLTTRDMRGQLNAVLTCGVPYSAFALLSLAHWGRFGIVVQLAVGPAALLLFGYLLREKPMSNAAAAPCLILALHPHGIHAAATNLVFYLVFLGPSEEVLFRGVMQSRLDAAFGRPFTFSGARWGWGTMIACALFAVAHVANPYALFQGRWQPNWWAGPITFGLALPLAYLRERTGGVLAPAVLHALPQSIARAIAAMSMDSLPA